jgi:hypothetical protein
MAMVISIDIGGIIIGDGDIYGYWRYIYWRWRYGDILVVVCVWCSLVEWDTKLYRGGNSLL